MLKVKREFKIIGGSGKSYFAMDKAGGISVKSPLNYEANDQFSLEIEVTDVPFGALGGALSDRSFYAVKVTDVNDAPEFVRSDPAGYVYDVPENEPVGFVVCELTVGDQDQPTNTLTAVVGGEDATDFKLLATRKKSGNTIFRIGLAKRCVSHTCTLGTMHFHTFMWHCCLTL